MPCLFKTGIFCLSVWGRIVCSAMAFKTARDSFLFYVFSVIYETGSFPSLRFSPQNVVLFTVRHPSFHGALFIPAIRWFSTQSTPPPHYTYTTHSVRFLCLFYWETAWGIRIICIKNYFASGTIFTVAIKANAIS